MTLNFINNLCRKKESTLNIVSFFRAPISNKHPEKSMSIADVHNYIIGDFAKQRTEKLRTFSDKDKAKKFKSNSFDYVTFYGVFSERNKEKLVSLSNLICIDFDHLQNLEVIFNKLLQDKYFTTALLFRSPSGDGLKWVIKNNNQKDMPYNDYCTAVFNYIKKQYGIEADVQCKDIARACFLPYDPNAFFNNNYESEKKKELFVPTNWQEHKKIVRKKTSKSELSQNVEEVIQKIEAQSIDITAGYENWLNIAFALCDEFGESGRDFFHRISMISPEYDIQQCDTQYTNCLKSKGQGITIATFYKLVKEAGIDDTSNNSNILLTRPANEWVDEAKNRPDPITFFNGLIVQNENTVLFASSNVGKSILATQIAEDIAKSGNKVLYIDLELSSKQFQQRYTDKDSKKSYNFSTNFYRSELDIEKIQGHNLENAILSSIEDYAKKDFSIFIVDNITYICNDSEKGAKAGIFMMNIVRLKKKYGLTMLIIAHTPKIIGYKIITQNDLAGSAKLINFFDAGIAIARSAKDNNLRYLKQVKVRTGEILYDSDNVVLLDLVQEKSFLQFVKIGYAKESEHLKSKDDENINERIEQIMYYTQKGYSYRAIKKELGISPATISRLVKKYGKNVSSVPLLEQTEHLKR